ncbi:hypothetical protein Tco_0403866 [Tanacetum coccineum]
MPRVPLSYQASACSLSTLHFLKFPENSLEVLKLLENSVEVLKILENKLESMKILENKFESLKLQENQPVDGLKCVICGDCGGKISGYMVKKQFLERRFGRERIIAKRDQEGNNSPEIETLPLFPIHGGSQHDFFGVKASDLSLDHSVGGLLFVQMVGPYKGSYD